MAAIYRRKGSLTLIRRVLDYVAQQSTGRGRGGTRPGRSAMRRSGTHRWTEADMVHYLFQRGAPPPEELQPRLAAPVAASTRTPAGGYVIYVDQLKTQTEKNTKGHWAPKARRAKAQRTLVYRVLQSQLGLACPLTLPLTITLTRIAPSQGLDDDNNQSALAHVRDAISDYLAGAYGEGQDRQEGLTFRYTQRTGGVGQYSVEISLEPGL